MDNDTVKMTVFEFVVFIIIIIGITVTLTFGISHLNTQKTRMDVQKFILGDSYAGETRKINNAYYVTKDREVRIAFKDDNGVIHELVKKPDETTLLLQKLINEIKESLFNEGKNND